MMTQQIYIDVADLGPSTGDQRHIIGADPGLMVSGDPGHNTRASSGLVLSGDQEHQNQIQQVSMRHRTQMAKQIMRFGTWNVRTLQQCGKVELMAAALHHYRVDVACLQEVRYPDQGSVSIIAADTDEIYKIYHSGCTNGQYGVALAIKSQLKPAVIDFQVVGDGICYITLNSHSNKLTVISVYAPTNGYDLAARQSFYDTLQVVVDSIPKSHFLAFGKDANAKLGQGLPTSRNFGPFATGVQCENGALLRNLCLSLC